MQFILQTGYHCWSDRLQHSECCNYSRRGPQTATKGLLSLSIINPHLHVFWDSLSFFYGLDLQAEKTQKQGGMVMCATVLVIMCVVMLVLLILKEIFFWSASTVFLLMISKFDLRCEPIPWQVESLTISLASIRMWNFEFPHIRIPL